MIEISRAVKECSWNKAKKILDENFPDERGIVQRCAAYVLAKASYTGGDLSTFESFLLSSFVRPQLAPVLSNELEGKWDRILSLRNLDPYECAAFLLNDTSAFSRSAQTETPCGVSRLAMELLQIQPTDSVADFCTGRGSFIRECVLSGKYAAYYGNEINEGLRSIALMRSDIMSGNITITSEDSLCIEKEYDKIFCNHPLGMKWHDYDETCTHSAAADWLFLRQVTECLAKKGKAVCIMTNGCTWNMCDREMRRKFTEYGIFEAIIALPQNIYEYSSVGTVMAVLSFGNRETTFIDASEIYESGRRCRKLSNENVRKILRCVYSETTLSRKVSISEIAANDYNLYPKTYTESSFEPVHAVSFLNIIKKITRGAQLKAAELDALVCNGKTGMKLLMLSDISSGMISEGLRNLRSIEERLDKYCVRSGDIIISKNGLPAKIAVADVRKGETVLANGNLYILEIDKEVADPYYIKAYLESEEGSAALKKMCVGVTIPNIPVDSLKKLRIPLPCMEEQKRIAETYKRNQNIVAELKKQLADAEKNMIDTYDLCTN